MNLLNSPGPCLFLLLCFILWVVYITAQYATARQASRDPSRRFCWRIDDDCESYIYSARDQAEAIEFHRQLFVIPSGEPEQEITVGLLADNELLTVQGDNDELVSQPCYEWAADVHGLVSTTAGM